MISASVFITKHAFPGFPKVIEGLSDAPANITPDMSWIQKWYRN